MREEALLAQVRVLTEKHEALAAATGENFNLFKILGRETDEVHTHSATLAELLNPNGSHGQGPVFARLFAKRFDIPPEGIDTAQVWSECTIDKESRIDILMTLGDDACVVVENKIYAGDQPRQLERYHEYAANWPNYKVIYLTLHGDDPSDESLGELSRNQRDKIECRSYESDVLAWLDACIKEVALVPQIREILAHYRALLRKLTGKSTGELIVDLKDLLETKQGDTYNFELVPEIAEAMAAFSVEKEWSFWQTLKERLQERGDRSWWLTYLDEPKAKLKQLLLKEVDEGIIRHAYGTGNKDKWWYGWTFRIRSKANAELYHKDGCEVLLRVECDRWGWCFYGFIAVENTPDALRRLARDDARCLLGDWVERMSELEGGWFTNNEWWLAQAYPDDNVPLEKKGWLKPGTIRRFVENDVIDSWVSDIHSSINLLEEWEGS